MTQTNVPIIIKQEPPQKFEQRSPRLHHALNQEEVYQKFERKLLRLYYSVVSPEEAAVTNTLWYSFDLDKPDQGSLISYPVISLGQYSLRQVTLQFFYSVDAEMLSYLLKTHRCFRREDLNTYTYVYSISINPITPLEKLRLLSDDY